jgi:hypothetical protein
MRYLLLIRGDESAAAHAEHPAATYGTIEVRELWPPL